MIIPLINLLIPEVSLEVLKKTGDMHIQDKNILVRFIPDLNLDLEYPGGFAVPNKFSHSSFPGVLSKTEGKFCYE